MKKLLENKYFVFSILLLLMFILSGTYAWLRNTISSEKINIIKAGHLDLILDESTSDGILIEKAIPMSFRQGTSLTPYTFSVRNNSNNSVDYELYIDDLELSDGETRLEDNFIRYVLVKNDEELVASNSKLLSEGRKIASTTIDKDIDQYKLYVWIDSKTKREDANVFDDNQEPVAGKIFYAQIRLEGTQSVNSGEYKVTFDTNGGSTIKEQYVKSGEPVVQTVEPSKEGFAFKYWSLSNNGEKYDLATPVNKNMTLYAVYKESKNPILAVSTKTSLFNNSNISRSVYKVVFSDSIDGLVECSETETQNCYTTTWDASANLDGSVNGYYNSNTGILTIAADGEKPIANPDSSNMFYNFGAYAGIDAAKLDTSRVTNMQYMFSSSNIVGPITGLETWNTSNVTNMQGLFMGQNSGGSYVNPVSSISDISGWDVSNVTNMNYLFQYTRNLNDTIDMSNWDVKKVDKASCMFYYSSADVNMSNLHFDNLDSFQSMFYASSGNINLSHTVFNKMTSVNGNTFDNATGTVDLSYASFPNLMGADYLVSNSNITSLDITNLNLGKITYLTHFIYKSPYLKEIIGSETLDTSNITSIQDTFCYLPNLVTLDLSGWDTSNATTMSNITYGSSSYGIFSSLKTLKLTNMTINDSTSFNGFLVSDAPALEYLDISSLEGFTESTRPSLLIGTSPCDTIVRGKPLTIKVKNTSISSKLINGITIDNLNYLGICSNASGYTKDALTGITFEY